MTGGRTYNNLTHDGFTNQRIHEQTITDVIVLYAVIIRNGRAPRAPTISQLNLQSVTAYWKYMAHIMLVSTLYDSSY